MILRAITYTKTTGGAVILHAITYTKTTGGAVILHAITYILKQQEGL